MRIRTRRPSWSPNTVELGLAKHVAEQLCESSREGSIERQSEVITNIAEAFGRLVEVLMENRRLSMDEVQEITHCASFEPVQEEE